jgi:hypothetical protein
LHIWKRGSIEGYFIEPNLLEHFFEKKEISDVSGVKITNDQIEEEIINNLKNMKQEILERFERRMIKRYLCGRSRGYTIDEIETITKPEKISKIREKVNDFNKTIDPILINNWREILPYVNCKKLLIRTVNRYVEYSDEKIIDLIGDILIYSKEKIKDKLPEGWDEITDQFTLQ